LSVHRPIGEVLRLDTSPGWRDSIIVYLKDGSLSDNRVEAQILLHLATIYTLLGYVLYKKPYSKLSVDPYVRYFRPDKARRDVGNP